VNTKPGQRARTRLFSSLALGLAAACVLSLAGSANAITRGGGAPPNHRGLSGGDV
jgi:hypothetical protein